MDQSNGNALSVGISQATITKSRLTADDMPMVATETMAMLRCSADEFNRERYLEDVLRAAFLAGQVALYEHYAVDRRSKQQPEDWQALLADAIGREGVRV